MSRYLEGSQEGVAVVGLGFVGLSTAACLASRGFNVAGLDKDQAKVRSLKKGAFHFHEAGLASLLKDGAAGGRLSFSSDRDEALEDAGVVFICVGTPGHTDGSIDISQVREASSSIGRGLKKKSGRTLLVVKSTVIPGTTQSVVRPLVEEYSRKSLGQFGLAVNPEFLREGSAIADTFSPDRIVIGVADSESGGELKAFYERFHGKEMPQVLLTTMVNAELVKYASNAFLATKVSFINEMASLCANLPGADVSVVARGIGMDRRIGPQFLRAGLGFGGSCLPKDVRALLAAARASRADLPIIEAVHERNLRQPKGALEMARKMLGELKGKRVAVLGLAFKPETDDVREAVSIRLVRELLRSGCRVVAYDPVAVPNARKVLGRRIGYASSVEACLKGGDCCIVVTEWDEFRRLEPKDFSVMRNKALVDGRRIYDPAKFEGKMRFAAVGLGRP